MSDFVVGFFRKLTDTISEGLRGRPLAIFSVSTFLFIILRLYFPIEPLLLLSIFLSLVVIYLNWAKKIDNFLMIFLILSMFVGIFASNTGIEKNDRIQRLFDGEYVRIEGVVSSIPTDDKYSYGFFLDTENILHRTGSYENNIKIYVKTKEISKISFGDKIRFNASLSSSDEVYSYLKTYYIAKGAPLVARDITLLDINNSEGSVVTKARNAVINIGDSFLYGDSRSLFKALVAGDRSDFSEELEENLARSGLSHIACVSGLHVSILGMALYRLLRKRSRLLSAIVSIAFVYFFAFLTGATPSTLRAAIMFTSFLVSKIAVRENDSFTALSFSAMLLAVINPYVIFDGGFILSYLSVLGIEVFSGYFMSVFRFIPDKISEPVSLTLSAQLMTLPAAVNMFGYVSLNSIVSNIIVSSIFVIALYLCFIFIPLSRIPYISSIAALVCSFFLDIIASVAYVFANLPHSAMSADPFDGFELFSYYMFVLLFVFRKKLSIWAMGGIILFCGILLIISKILI